MVTTEEAAKQLGISRARLTNMIREGKAKPLGKFGHAWMWTPEEIERLRNQPKAKGGRPKKQ